MTPRGIAVNVLEIVVREFELLSLYYVTFLSNNLQKGMGSLIFPPIGITTVLL